MKILVFGKNGQLGTELMKKAISGFDMTGMDYPDVDFCKPETIEAAIAAVSPDIIINAAAYTAVDKAESEPELAFAVNAEGPYHIARVCSERGIPLIHISTDYVFDGTKEGPYIESDEVCPISVYGKSKAEGERKVRGTLDKHIIIRTAWLYSAHGSNFVKTMLRLGAERETISVVADQKGSPTSAFDLADAIMTIVGKIDAGAEIRWGTYHYTGCGSTTWHGFAKGIFEEARKYVKLKINHVKAIISSEYPTAAARPKNSVLGCTGFVEAFGIPTKIWEQSLAVTIYNMYNS